MNDFITRTRTRQRMFLAMTSFCRMFFSNWNIVLKLQLVYKRKRLQTKIGYQEEQYGTKQNKNRTEWLQRTFFSKIGKHLLPTATTIKTHETYLNISFF